MAPDPTAVTEAAFDLQSIKEMMDNFDPAALLPEINGIVGVVRTVCTVAILVGPIVLLGMGIAYLLFAPREANYYFGYRTTFGMGSVSAWRHTQRVAGFLFGGLGAVLTLIMLLISLTLSGREPMVMVTLALECLIWEAVLVVIAVLSINSIAAFTFDFKGNKRRKPQPKRREDPFKGLDEL